MINTLFIGKVLLEFEELESTNAFLMVHAGGASYPEGTVVQAKYQTQGRGQHGKSWSSAPGMNLMLSILLAPSWMEVKRQWVINACIAVAVADWVSGLLPRHQVKIKWPNDIMVDGRKLAGILLQNTLRGQQWQWCVAGIGLNVHQTHWEDPSVRATSLGLLDKGHWELTALRDGLLSSVEQHYLRCKGGDTYRQEYLQYLYKRGEYTRFYDRKTQAYLMGVPMGVSTGGHLLLEAQGEQLEYGFQEIQWILED